MSAYRRFREYQFNNNKIFVWFSSFGRVGSRENYHDLNQSLWKNKGRDYTFRNYSDYLKNKKFISIYK